MFVVHRTDIQSSKASINKYWILVLASPNAIFSVRVRYFHLDGGHLTQRWSTGFHLPSSSAFWCPKSVPQLVSPVCYVDDFVFCGVVTILKLTAP